MGRLNNNNNNKYQRMENSRPMPAFEKKGCHNTGQKRKWLRESKSREQRRLGLKEAKPDTGKQTLDLCNGAGTLTETFVLVGRRE